MTRTELRVNGEVVPRTDYKIVWKQQKEEFDTKVKEASLLVIDRLMQVINGSKSDVAVVQAAKEINQRAWGAAEAHVNHSGSIEHQHTISYADTLRQLYEHLDAQVIEAEVIEERADAAD